MKGPTWSAATWEGDTSRVLIGWGAALLKSSWQQAEHEPAAQPGSKGGQQQPGLEEEKRSLRSTLRTGMVCPYSGGGRACLHDCARFSLPPLRPHRTRQTLLILSELSRGLPGWSRGRNACPAQRDWEQFSLQACSTWRRGGPEGT